MKINEPEAYSFSVHLLKKQTEMLFKSFIELF